MNREILSQPISARSVLGQVLEHFGLTAGFSRHNIVNLWPSIVNETVARHAKADRISGSTLHVIVDSSVWMNEMGALKKVLLSKINACLDKGAAPISDIRYQQRSWARDQDSKTAIPVEPEIDQKELRVIQKLLEPIKNEDLRCVIKRVREKDWRLKRRRSKN